MIEFCAEGLKFLAKLSGWQALEDNRDWASVSLFMGKMVTLSALLGVFMAALAWHIAGVPFLTTIVDAASVGSFIAGLLVLGTLYLLD